MLGFKSFDAAQGTLVGIELMHMMASIMASATPFYFCAMQEHLTIER
jgi:hypothetical protein